MKLEWIRCPLCGSKTRNRIREDSILKNYPLYCPKCRQEIILVQFSYQIIDEDTQPRMTGFSLRISVSCLVDLLLLMMSLTLPRKALIAVFDGFMSNLSLYLRIFLPRKSRRVSMFLASVIIAGSFMAMAASAAQPEEHTHGFCSSCETAVEPQRAVPCGCAGFYRKVIGWYRCDKCGDFIEGSYLS